MAFLVNPAGNNRDLTNLAITNPASVEDRSLVSVPLDTESALLERVDDDEGAKALADVQVFGVEFVAAGFDCCLHDHCVPERKVRSLLQFDGVRQQFSGVLDDSPGQVLLNDLESLSIRQRLLQLARNVDIKLLQDLHTEDTVAIVPEFDDKIASDIVLGFRIAVLGVHENVRINEAWHGRAVLLAREVFLHPMTVLVVDDELPPLALWCSRVGAPRDQPAHPAEMRIQKVPAAPRAHAPRAVFPRLGRG